MTKILLWGFKQCFRPFNVRNLSNRAFCSVRFQKAITSETNFFPNYSKFYVELGNAEKDSENDF